MWKYGRLTDRLKMVSLQLSSLCQQKPRCNFCYIDRKIEDNPPAMVRAMEYILRHAKVDTVCIEYNLYNGSTLTRYMAGLPSMTNVTMTTMPMTILRDKAFQAKADDERSNVFCRLIEYGISAIAISYDSEKVTDPKVWIVAAGHITDLNHLLGKDVTISCNYLIEHIPMDIPYAVLHHSQQVNLLTLKPTGRLTEDELNIIAVEIEYMRTITDVAVDSCLGVQLGYMKMCPAGRDFLTILPDGTIKACCFGDKCFLYDEKVDKIADTYRIRR